MAAANELKRRCQCSFQEDKIINAGFRCFPESPQAVTYRATILGIPQAPTPDLQGYLADWVASGASVVYQAQLLTVDRTCTVAISSLGDDECGSGGFGGPSAPPGTSTRPLEQSQAREVGIIGIAVGVAVCVVLVAAIVMVAVLVCVHKHRGSKKESRTSER